MAGLIIISHRLDPTPGAKEGELRRVNCLVKGARAIAPGQW